MESLNQSEFSVNLIKNFSFDEERKEFSKLLKLCNKIRKKEISVLYTLKPKILKYKDYPSLKLTKEETLKLLPEHVNLELNKNLIELYSIKYFENEIKTKDNEYSNYFSLNIFEFIRSFLINNISNIEIDNFLQKIEFVFEMYDLEDKFYLTINEFEHCLKLLVEGSCLNFDLRTIKTINQTVFEQKSSNKTIMTKEEFISFMFEYGNKELTSEAKNSFMNYKAGIDEKEYNIDIKNLSDIQKTEKVEKKLNFLQVFCKIYGKLFFWQFFYILGSIGVVLYFDIVFYDPGFYSKLFARGFAGLIMYNIALLLIFVCNTLNTFLSKTFLGSLIPFENFIKYHKLVGILTILYSYAHTVSHLFGTYFYLTAFDDVNELNKHLHTKVEAVPTWSWLAFESTPGITGFILVSIVTLIGLSAINYVRQRNFELFMYSHYLYLPFVILPHFHGSQQIVVTQVYYKFMIFPSVYFILDKLVLLFRICLLRSDVISIKHLCSNIIEINFRKPKYFNYIAGQYLSINVPKISYLQWHPFTISSFPDDEIVSVHINPVGNWTRELKQLSYEYTMDEFEKQKFCNNGLDCNGNPPTQIKSAGKVFKSLKILISGPYNAPAQHYFRYKSLMLIASGIGATPFSSVLYNVLHMLKNPENENLKELIFIGCSVMQRNLVG